MDITTKFQIGDTVWTVKDNKAYSFEVYDIRIRCYENCYKTWVNVDILYSSSLREEKHYWEDQLVSTYEELINLL